MKNVVSHLDPDLTRKMDLIAESQDTGAQNESTFLLDIAKHADCEIVNIYLIYSKTNCEERLSLSRITTPKWNSLRFSKKRTPHLEEEKEKKTS